MEPESRPPRRFLDLPGLEERNQSARRPIDRIQILPEEPGWRGHLGMLSGPWRVQCQPIADRASFGASPPERYSQLAVSDFGARSRLAIPHGRRVAEAREKAFSASLA